MKAGCAGGPLVELELRCNVRRITISPLLHFPAALHISLCLLVACLMLSNRVGRCENCGNCENCDHCGNFDNCGNFGYSMEIEYPAPQDELSPLGLPFNSLGNGSPGAAGQERRRSIG